ncbi:hypothetical protein HF888_05280 [Bermanella marisrubri]|nr:hypothetical protein [Bermanella marisrubri]QIZ83669.1 hypothetical protein HF888_05280 [Bermanella marisrubri]
MNETSRAQSHLETLHHKTDLQKRVLEEAKRFQQHLATNTPITTERQDPITQRYAVDERTTLNPDKKVGMTIWSDAKYYLKSDIVNVYARLMNKDQQPQVTTFSAVLLQGQQRTITKIELADNDQDKLYQGTIDLAQYDVSPGIYNVQVVNHEYQVIDDISFTLSQPDIEVTGEEQSFINDNGNLQWDIEVNVSEVGRYYIQGSLYSLTRVAISSSQNSFELSTGKQNVSLIFDGGLIQESQENGPYVIKKLSLAKVTMPMQRAPLLKPEFQSASYRLEEFK